MSVVEPGSSRSKLVERVRDILFRPSPTWDVIAAEPASVSGLYKGWILPLAAIAPVCQFIGSTVFGVGIPGLVVYKPSIAGALSSAVVTYALSLVSVYLLALIVDVLAPNFGGQRDRLQALKVAAYSSTAAWLAGVFNLIPAISILALLGLYSFYLLYKGLPRLMRSPEDKSVPYIALVIVCAIVLFVVVAAIASPLMRMGGPGPAASAPAGELKVGGSAVELSKLEEASKRLEAAAKQVEAAAAGKTVEGGATDPDAIKVHLPATVGEFARTQLSTGSGGIAGMEGSTATAEYVRGDSRMTLAVTDMGAMGALAALGGAFNFESTSDKNGKRERISKENGRMTMEEYDAGARHGSYGMIIGERFMVQAEGDGVTLEELKAAVGAVDAGQLERLARAS